jgi:undecaprenyl-diphosphatase
MVTAQLVVTAERLALQGIQELRWGPITVAFVLLSGWWMKGLFFVAVAAAGDIRSRRQFPLTTAFSALSVVAGALLVNMMKESIDRARPGEAHPVALEPSVETPGSPSFPSGHTATAFAAAAVVAAFYPRLRWPIYGLAALVGLSRMYLGVHFTLDVIAGAILGLIVGKAAVWCAHRLPYRLRHPLDSRHS